MAACRYGIPLLVFNSIACKWDIELSWISLCTPMHFSLFILLFFYFFIFFTVTHSACIFHALSTSTHPSSKFQAKSGKYFATFLSEAMESGRTCNTKLSSIASPCYARVGQSTYWYRVCTKWDQPGFFIREQNWNITNVYYASSDSGQYLREG